MLTLAKALKTGRLQEFIRQQERARIGPADRERFNDLICKAVKSKQSAGQTSGSRVRGDLPEK